MKLQGTITAMVTPFTDDALDLLGLVQNIRFQILHGVDGILVLGTTGESSTLDKNEQNAVIKAAFQETEGKIPLWVGTGSYCTKMTIEKTKQAQDLGADVALIVTPYFNKPGQEGIYKHYEAISKSVNIPIVVYNIPGRCGTNIEALTLKRIASLPNIIGVKEASGNMLQASDILHTILSENPSFKVLSGDDALTLPLMALGASGVVSVISNLVPNRVVAMVKAALANEFDVARKIYHELASLCKAAFIETNPVPIKTAMTLCNMPSGDCRLPLSSLSEINKKNLRDLLYHMQLITS